MTSLSAANDVAVADTSSVQGRTERILLALSDDEKREFLGKDGDALSLNSVSCQQVPPSIQRPGKWAEFLEEYQPTIIVSCWSTLRIPDDMAESRNACLRYVCHISGSVRHVVPRGFLERGGLVSNWGGLASAPVAEHALLLALSCLRNQGQWRPFIERRDSPGAAGWHQIPSVGTRTLFGRRVGIHGFGQIARALVRLLQPFGVEIRAWSEGVPPAFMQEAGVLPTGSLADLFAGSDIVFECEALTPKTIKSVTASLLGMLPDEAVFINVGRGMVVDEDGLCREAARGRIRIGLDVVAQEPVKADSPLLFLPNVILSPHIGGPTLDLFANCGRGALANIRNYLTGRPVENRVTLEIYDRST